MNWVKMKFAAAISLGVVLAGGLGILAFDRKTSSHLEFYTFLKNPPIISKAVYERELSYRQMPDEASRQIFEFSLDGGNYLLTIRDEDGPHSGSEFETGQYGQLSWLRQSGHLQLFDLQLNKIEGKNGNIPYFAEIQQLNPLMRLGVLFIDPTSKLTWTDSGRQLFAKGANGQNVTVEFRGEEPPTSALVASEMNHITNYFTIVYKYSRGFNDGRFPHEIAYYRGATTDDGNKLFVVRVRYIEVTANHLTADILDPRKVYKTPAVGLHGGLGLIFYSNNIEYSVDVDATGRAGRVHVLGEHDN